MVWNIESNEDRRAFVTFCIEIELPRGDSTFAEFLDIFNQTCWKQPNWHRTNTQFQRIRTIEKTLISSHAPEVPFASHIHLDKKNNDALAERYLSDQLSDNHFNWRKIRTTFLYLFSSLMKVTVGLFNFERINLKATSVEKVRYETTYTRPTFEIHF